MALYSVWDWNKNLYKVYGDARPVSVGVDPDPPRPSNVHILGAVPFDAAKTLPANVKFMGLSHVPRGEIVRDVRTTVELMGLGSDAGGAKPVAVAGVALVSGLIGYLIARWSR